MWPIFQRELLMGARDPVFRHLRVGAGLVAWVGLAISVHLLLAGWAVRISLFDRGTHPEALFWPALGLWIAPMAGLCVSATVRSVTLGLFVSTVCTALLPVPGLILRHVVSERTWGGAAVWGMLGLAGILFTLKARELIGSRELALTYLRKP